MHGFREWIREKDSTYSIFTAKSPIEKVASKLTKLFKIEDWQKNVDRNGSLANLKGVPIVQLKESAWTVVYWTTQRYLNIKRDCRNLSQKLNSTVVQIWETDTTGWTEWLVWERGEEREGCERMSDDEPYLRSTLRRVPNLDNLRGHILRQRLANLVDELLTEQEINIPSLQLDLSDSNIARVDLLIGRSQPLGMLDFQKFIYEGHPEYAIFAVKANIDRVSPVIAEYCHANEWKKDIQEKTKISKVTAQNNRYWMPIIQPQDNEWTVVYGMIGGWEAFSETCLEISAKLNTKVANLQENDTSGAIAYHLFEKGKTIESAGWAPGGEFYIESELREEPEFDDFEEDEGETISRFIDDIFIEQGIYIPAWDLDVTDECLERVDLMPQA